MLSMILVYYTWNITKFIYYMELPNSTAGIHISNIQLYFL